MGVFTFIGEAEKGGFHSVGKDDVEKDDACEYNGYNPVIVRGQGIGI